MSADGKRLAVEPCRTAPQQTTMPRRAVPQMIQRMPSVAAPPAALPGTGIHPATPGATPVPGSAAPLPILGCTLAGCYDSNGVFHITGAGNATIGPGGKLCNRDGVWLQCQ
ncbi:hypothetical protein HSX11_15790 [Oxalobacteraceae bacterium]|nr:hypothetical protein [Oxalobacteraceae bacterium]